MRSRVVFSWIVLAGCSSEGAGSTSGAGSASSALSSPPPQASGASAEDREAVLAFFADLGDLTGAELKRVSESKPKSRLAYAEPLARATPAAVPLHSELLDKRRLTKDRFARAMSDPAVQKQAMAGLEATLKPFMVELGALPAATSADCAVFARRLIELGALGPSQKPLLVVLGASLQTCVGVAPEALFRCMPSPGKPGTVPDFDACMATGGPAQTQK